MAAQLEIPRPAWHAPLVHFALVGQLLQQLAHWRQVHTVPMVPRPTLSSVDVLRLQIALLDTVV